nr:T-cell receptor alpha chain precursor V region (BTA43) - bovine [Bos taurus]
MKTQRRVLLSLLWIQICCLRVQQMKVEQSPGVLTLQEGRNSSLICNYSISMTSVQWFQQNPDGRLISLFYIASGMQQKGRLKSTINSKERYSQLYIRDSQPGDSATYFCAAIRTDNSRIFFGTGTQVVVKPK